MTWCPVPPGSPFPITNLPLGRGCWHDQPPRTIVAIGDHAIDLDDLAHRGGLDDAELSVDPRAVFVDQPINVLLANGVGDWRALRNWLGWLLSEPAGEAVLAPSLVDRAEIAMVMPLAVGDFVDFYSSLHHATNLGQMFRPDSDPLLPNWRALPVGYHGRSSTIVVDRTPIVRPNGLRPIDGDVRYGPTAQLDIEVELATVLAGSNDLGRPIAIADASRHIAGVCVLNDWSARDIQRFEYQPLGPFGAKSFATSIAPWLVSIDALAPFRVDSPTQEPPVAEYLRHPVGEQWGFDLHFDVTLSSAAMRQADIAPMPVSAMGFADMYWTPAQQLAHLTVTGATIRPGDLFGSGTVSGPTIGSEGSLIERTHNGDAPLTLPTGERRTFLDDGDTITITGWAGTDPVTRIGLGTVTGTVMPTAAGHSSTQPR